MKQGQLRDKITDAVDEVESAVGDILEDLKGVEDIANWDAEALSKADIESLQGAVIEAIKGLMELLNALY